MEWHKLAPSYIRNGRDENGSRLVLAFAQEFENRLGRRLNTSCPNCFLEDYREYKNLFNTDTMSKYKVHPMYEGLTSRIDGKHEVLSSVNLTDEQAEKFVRNHPKGLGLFQKYPESAKEIEGKADNAKSLASNRDSREDLDARATALGLNPEDYKNKSQIADAINKLEAAEVTE